MTGAAQPVNLILTAAQMQAADRETIGSVGIAGVELMERAGAAVADAVSGLIGDGAAAAPVVIVAGPGNNGGDGFAAARILYEQQIDVTVALIGTLKSLKGDAAAHAQKARKAGVEFSKVDSDKAMERLAGTLAQAGCIVDALFGTGLARPPEGRMAEVVRMINGSNGFVLAVDIASGIDCDSGRVLGEAVRADATLPIAASKWGHWLQQGVDHAGDLLPPADIGIPAAVMLAMQQRYSSGPASARLISGDEIADAFPKRQRDTHKYRLGHLWICGGSTGFTGAPRLAAQGAQAVGTGLVSIACPAEVWPVIAAASLETMVHPYAKALWQQAAAVVAGPGWGRGHERDLTDLLLSDRPLLLDADALNMVAGERRLAELLRRRAAVTVMTPHPGEAGRLLGVTSGEVQGDRPGALLELQQRYGCWVVLKGPATMIVSPERDIWLSPFGSARLATAGSGDVLSGMIGGLLAQGIQPWIAVPAAVGLHGLVGEAPGWHRAGELETVIATMIEERFRA